MSVCISVNKPCQQFPLTTCVGDDISSVEGHRKNNSSDGHPNRRQVDRMRAGPANAIVRKLAVYLYDAFRYMYPRHTHTRASRARIALSPGDCKHQQWQQHRRSLPVWPTRGCSTYASVESFSEY